jgi:hypothetical protein
MAKKKEAKPIELTGVRTKEELAAALKERGIELTPELEQQIKLTAMRDLAIQDDGPQGFACFYELATGTPLPIHAKKEWVEPIFGEAKRRADTIVNPITKQPAQDNKVVVEAFRGSTKSTTMNLLTAFMIGKNPDRSNLIVRVSDDSAKESAEAVTDIIKNNPAWKAVFPYVVPDSEKGWGEKGYEVKRTDIDYSTWRAMNAMRQDPTLLGLSYDSDVLIGKHPTGMMLVDDIHNEKNTSSSRMLNYVMRILQGTIFQAITPTTWNIFIGTPWVENDALSYVISTGLYAHFKTPVLRLDPTSNIEFNGQKVRLTWPERFSIDKLNEELIINGTLQFARMYLLDLTMAKSRWFRYQGYPASQVKVDWQRVGGVDPAGVGNAQKIKEGKLDFFAMGYVAPLPGGGAVVTDGVLQRCTQAEAEVYMRQAQSIFPGFRMGVESDGKGEDFIAMITRNPGLRIIPVRSKKRSKQERYRMMQPWFENGIVKVSDAETPFLNELRRELENYPYVENDDALDAVFWALTLIPNVVNMPELYRFGEDGEVEYSQWRGKRRSPNPYLALVRR